MTIQQDQNSSNEYFDLHVNGVGYLNRVREVPVKRGDSFWACDIAALHGSKEDVQTTRFDCRVSGTEAITLVQDCVQAVTDEKKVLIGFKLGDLYADTFVYEKGDKKGQTGVSLKARLLFISWIKVDGETVYKAPVKTSADASESEASAVEGELLDSESQTSPKAAKAA